MRPNRHPKSKIPFIHASVTHKARSRVRVWEQVRKQELKSIPVRGIRGGTERDLSRDLRHDCGD